MTRLQINGRRASGAAGSPTSPSGRAAEYYVHDAPSHPPPTATPRRKSGAGLQATSPPPTTATRATTTGRVATSPGRPFGIPIPLRASSRTPASVAVPAKPTAPSSSSSSASRFMGSRRASLVRDASAPASSPSPAPSTASSTSSDPAARSLRHSRPSLTPLEAAVAAHAIASSSSPGPVSAPARTGPAPPMTLPEPIHAPAQRSPKLARVSFTKRFLTGSMRSILSSGSGSSQNGSARSVIAEPQGVSGAAVKVPLARDVAAGTLPSISTAAAGANVAPPAIASAPAASSGAGVGAGIHMSLSYLIGNTKPHRATVVLSLDQLRVPPRPLDLTPYVGCNQPALVGLVNVGNTCFMAAALQCLVSIDVLTNYMLNDVSRDINPFSDSKGSIAKAYILLLREMITSKGAVNPRAFKREVEKYAPQFVGYDQQDAQEFLRYLLDALSSDLCRVPHETKFAVREADEDALPYLSRGDVAWSKYRHLQASLVTDVFAGQLMSSVRCWVCNGVFRMFDVFCDLSVPIPGRGGPVHLADCLREFAREEELEPNEWYHCPQCKKRQRTSKRLQVHRLPPVLVVHLKRFASLRHKLTTPVAFPLADLDLSDILTPEASARNPRRYRLVGVLQHSGTLFFGHYIASVLRRDQWYCMDDAGVARIADPARAAAGDWAASAYVLFYQAVGATG
ncbi:Ubiquitin carboxyl-terminal hydrolase 2 [Blastocladiella emersonii ATCC 22665]|nr:Ubiquitin carboxyl-terminal hydrolase 2 [Blastocladiella emersonii ATCC 22665]